jgi:hypothetical protein
MFIVFTWHAFIIVFTTTRCIINSQKLCCILYPLTHWMQYNFFILIKVNALAQPSIYISKWYDSGSDRRNLRTRVKKWDNWVGSSGNPQVLFSSFKIFFVGDKSGKYGGCGEVSCPNWFTFWTIICKMWCNYVDPSDGWSLLISFVQWLFVNLCTMAVGRIGIAKINNFF